MTRTILSAKQHQFLRDIGLSRDAISLYRLLLARKSLTAHEAGIELHTFASATYRLFYRLESLGLVQKMAGRPVSFMPMPGQEALKQAYQVHTHDLARLLQLHTAQALDDVEIIAGRKMYQDRYLALVAGAERSIDAFSAGAGIARSLYAAESAAIRRGVNVRRVIQWLRPVDRDAAIKQIRLGAHLRQNLSAHGCHFVLIDNARVLINFTDPHNTERGVSIVSTNHSLVLLFESQFNELWAKGREAR